MVVDSRACATCSSPPGPPEVVGSIPALDFSQDYSGLDSGTMSEGLPLLLILCKEMQGGITYYDLGVTKYKNKILFFEDIFRVKI